MRRYIHVQEDEEVGFSERAYQAREEILDYKGREVLYLIVDCTGFTCCDSSYTSHLETVRVVGYVTRWKYDTNEDGEAVSEIEPIGDKETQQEVRKILKNRYMVNITF